MHVIILKRWKLLGQIGVNHSANILKLREALKEERKKVIMLHGGRSTSTSRLLYSSSK